MPPRPGIRWYAEAPARRTRQLLGDVFVMVWVVVWVRVGRWVHDLVGALAAPGRALSDAGRDLAGAADAGGTRIEDLPVVGGALSRPFDAVTSAGDTLARAGEGQQEAVATLALVLGLVVGGLPIAWLLGRWVPGRVRWVRAATAAGRLRAAGAGDALFALRALTARPLHELAAVSKDPYGDWTRGEHRRLAGLELEALGLHPTPPGEDPPSLAPSDPHQPEGR